MKKRLTIFTYIIFLFSVGCSSKDSILENAKSYYPKQTWTKKLPYQANEIYPIEFDETDCPLVKVKINKKPFWFTFDFGSDGGMLITTAIEDSIEFTFLQELKTYNTDGSIRGTGKKILLENIEVFGKRYKNVTCNLFDWRTFSSFPNNGAISLEFIENTCFTLDYKSKELAVCNKPFKINAEFKNDFIIIDLLKSPEWNKYGLYVNGKVNNKDISIYIDSGSSHTFIDKRILSKEQASKITLDGYCYTKIPVEIGGLKFTLNKVRIHEINRDTNYEYPVRMKIGSDVMKYLVFTVDRTTNRNFLIIHK